MALYCNAVEFKPAKFMVPSKRLQPATWDQLGYGMNSETFCNQP